MAQKMLIRMNTSMVGTDPDGDEFIAHEGLEYEVDPAWGKILCTQHEGEEQPRAEPVAQTAAAKRQTATSKRATKAEHR